MAQLQSTNVTGTLCVNGVAVGGGKNYKYACFTASDTWTPSSDLTTGNAVIDAVVIAGGGGGGGSAACISSPQGACKTIVFGGGGGAGEIIHRTTVIDSTDACTITIGAGGLSGSMTVNDGVNSSKGGNTEAVGYVAYGGGGGGGGACTRQVAGINCSDNRSGGPAGGAAGFHTQDQASCVMSKGCTNSMGDSFSPDKWNMNYDLNPVVGGNNYCKYTFSQVAPSRQVCTVSASWGNIDNVSGSDEVIRTYWFSGQPAPGFHWDNGLPLHARGGTVGKRNSEECFGITFASLANPYYDFPTSSIGYPGYGTGGEGSLSGCCGTITGCFIENHSSPTNGADGIVVLRWQE